MKVTAQPILLRDEHVASIERALTAYLRETLFDPLQELLAGRERHNEEGISALWKALQDGSVWYAVNLFAGTFNAEISRELRAIGARKTADGFRLDRHEVPFALRGIIAQSAHRSTALHKALLAFLLLAEDNLPQAGTGLGFKSEVDNLVSDLQQQLVRTVAGSGAPLTPPGLPPGLAPQLGETLGTNLDAAIRNFTLEETQRLRAKVQQNLSLGGRPDRLEQVIASEFGVSQRKARFLAENETSRLVSRFRQDRYEALGASTYIWDTSHDERVRPTHGESNDHRSLDGRTFAWAVPPVVDSATGRRCHPGQDWNCRCLSLPVFTFA